MSGKPIPSTVDRVNRDWILKKRIRFEISVMAGFASNAQGQKKQQNSSKHKLGHANNGYTQELSLNWPYVKTFLENVLGLRMKTNHGFFSKCNGGV